MYIDEGWTLLALYIIEFFPPTASERTVLVNVSLHLIKLAGGSSTSRIKVFAILFDFVNWPGQGGYVTNSSMGIKGIANS